MNGALRNTQKLFRGVLLILVGSLLSITLIHAQTGPGGVGNANGSGGQPENLMWLDASSLNLSNNAQVSNWTDRSGNGREATQTTAVNRPLFKTNYLNGRPAIYFDNSVTSEKDRLDFDGSVLVNTDYTVMIVGTGRSSTKYRWMGGTATSGTNTNLTLGWDGTDYIFDQRNNGITTATATNPESFNIFTHSSEIGMISQDLILFQNGNEIASTTLMATGLTSFSGAALGRWTNQYYDIDVAEVIFYKNALNQVQRILVENYLSAKYNITLSANDYYAESSSNGHTYDVVGIGRNDGESHIEANTAGLILTPANGSLDADGEFLIAGHDNTTNTTTSVNLGTGVIERWARSWYIDKTGTLDANITFDFSEAFPGAKYPVDKSGYALLRYNGSTFENVGISEANKSVAGDKITFSVSDADLIDGIYTLGSTDNSISPVAGLDVRTWYSYQSGNWNDPSSWTLDGGVIPLLENPDNETPQPTDRVIITSGRTITMDVNNISTNSLEVIGELDLGASTGHNFNIILGNGKILLTADNFPEGDASGFSSAGTGGTVEIYGTGTTFTQAYTYNHLIVNLSGGSNTVTLTEDLTLNGNLSIQQGVLQINDNSTGAANRKIISVLGNITVGTNGAISLGSGTIRSDSDNVGGTYGDYHQSFHQLIVHGDLTNNGTIRLTNLSTPRFSGYDNSAASLVMAGTNNSTITCNGITDLYNLVIDKGTDQTYEVTLTATAKNYFALFGKNNNSWNTNGGNPETQKALWIKAGTLRLQGYIFIPSLTEGGNDFQIGENARLILDGANVVVHNTANEDSDWTGFSFSTPSGVDTGGSNQGLYPFGTLQIDNGYFLLGEAVAISFRDEAPGQIEVNGGELSATQIALSNSAATGNYGLTITGGILRLTDYQSRARSDYAMLHLPTENMVFSMSGGNIIVEGESGSVSNNGILIASAEENYQVSGGTVTINYNGITAIQINSTAPFFNLDIQDRNVSLLSELTILGNLTIPASKSLTANNHNVTIGNNLTINGTYTPGTNTTTFNSNAHSELTLNGSMQLYNFTVAKDTEAAEVDITTGTLTVDNELRVERGVLRYNSSTINAKANVYNAGTIGIVGSSGKLVLNGTASQIITVAEGNLFTNLELDNTNNVALSGGDMAVQANLTLTNGIFDINTHKLTLRGASANIVASGLGSSKMIQTAGNDSDGGLEMYVDAAETITFPVGIAANYTPASVVVSSNYSDDGYIRVNPVNERLSTLNSSGNALDYYWRVRHAGFTNRSLLVSRWSFTYHSNISVGSGRPAFVIYEDDPNNPVSTGSATDPDLFKYERVKESNNTNGVSGTTVIFEGDIDQINSTNSYNRILGPFSLVEAKYTVAAQAAINGSLEVYYSRQSGDWRTNATWSTTSHTGAAASDYPKVGDVAVIGVSGTSNHEVQVTNQETVAEVIFNPSTRTDGSEGRPKLVFPNASNGSSPHTSYSSNFNVFSVQSPTGTNPGFPTIEFYVNGNWNGTTFTLPSADYGDFINYTNTQGEISEITFNYSGSSSAGTAILPNTINAFPDLRFQVEGDNATTYAQNRVIVLPSVDFTVRRRMRLQDGIIVRFSNATNGNANIKWLLLDNDEPSRLQFQGNGTARTVTIDSLLEYESAATYSADKIIEVSSPSSGTLAHNLIVNGDILMNSGVLDLYHGDPSLNTNVTLTLGGSTNSSFINTGGQTPDLYRIVTNKGEGQTYTFTFQNSFILNGPTDGSTKALSLQNGTLILNDPAIDIDLSTGGNDFSLPSTAALEVTQGTVSVSGNDTGIVLDGMLRVNGGTVNVGTCGTATDYNYIEYSASGNALLEVSSGTLTVGSQIRRGLNNSSGVLKYRQTGGTVTIGSCPDASPEASRGMLEVLNSGSEFTHTGGSLTIVRQNDASSATASLLLNPTTFNTTNSDIYLGNANTPAGQTNFNINSAIALNKLTLSGINNPVYNMVVRSLVLNGELNINSGASLNAGGLQLTLKRDFVNDGTYTPAGNTTVFSGTSSQQIRGNVNTTFFNLSKTASNTLTVSGVNISVEGDLLISSGTLNDGGNTILLEGDLVHSGTHTTPAGGSGQGIVFAGNSRQELSRTTSGSSNFGKLSIDNPSGVLIPEGDGYNFIITDELRLKTGVFDIGGSLLTVTETAEIVAVNTFGSGNMIQTNSSFTDNGLKKIFNAISSATTVIFPVGHAKYTPVSFNITSSSAGNITVRPANERHPSIVEDTEPVTQITDADNVLQYHWIVKADGISGFTGTATMAYSQNDVRTTSPYTEADYIPAFIYSNETFWDKSLSVDGVDEANNIISFPFSSVSDANMSGDYTAGILDAIPDQIPQYESTGAGGDYTAQATWTPLNGAPAVVEGVGPVGAIINVKAGDLVSLNNNNIRIYRTNIESGGTIEINGTSGHRLGELSGTGMLRVSSNTSSAVLPAGNYENFFACSGGTLEYSGSGSYNVLGGISSLRNLIISGTGTKSMANTDLTVCNDLIINGAILSNSSSKTINVQRNMQLSGGSYTNQEGTLNISQDLLLSNAASTFSGGTGGNKTIGRNLTISNGNFQVGSGGSVSIVRNLTYSGGTFSGGSNQAKLVMSGSTAQTISGNFTGTSQLHKLEVNNSSTGVSLAGDVDINSELLLSEGLLRPGANSLKLNQNASVTPSTGNANSYVNGRLLKVIPNGGSFTFPVGKGGRRGYVGVNNVSSSSTLTWRAEYFSANVDNNEASVSNFTPSNNGGESIASISHNEYWKISDDEGTVPSGTVTATIQLRWDGQSDVSANSTERSDLRVMTWNADNSNWDNFGGGGHVGTQSLGTLSSSSPVSFSEKIITLGSTDLANPLPVELLSFTVKMQDKAALLLWATASEKNNDFFEIERSVNGQEWKNIGRVQGAGDSHQELTYSFTDKNPLYGASYYRLRQVDFDGQFDYSNVVVLENFENYAVTPDPEMVLYPNPASLDELIIRAFNLKPWMEVEVILLDAYGKQYIYKIVMPEELEKGLALKQNLNLASGLYLVSIKQGSIRMQKKLILK